MRTGGAALFFMKLTRLGCIAAASLRIAIVQQPYR
jgi:hypothetical protein